MKVILDPDPRWIEAIDSIRWHRPGVAGYVAVRVDDAGQVVSYWHDERREARPSQDPLDDVPYLFSTPAKAMARVQKMGAEGDFPWPHIAAWIYPDWYPEQSALVRNKDLIRGSQFPGHTMQGSDEAFQKTPSGELGMPDNSHPLVGAQIESVTPSATEALTRRWSTLDDALPVYIVLMKRMGRPSRSTSSSLMKTQKYATFTLFPMSDPEGSSAGTIFGMDRSGEVFPIDGSAEDELSLRGLTIKDVRPMTQEELAAQMWDILLLPHQAPTALVLGDKSILFPSRDPEGNGPGVWVVQTRDKEELL